MKCIKELNLLQRTANFS